MEEQYEFDVYVPNFRHFQSTVLELDSRTINTSLLMDMDMHIYPNGDTTENEGYVSVHFNLLPLVLMYGSFSLNCTVSLVDANKELRFGQSFGMDTDEVSVEALTNWIRLDKFVKRDVLLESSEELLPADRLTLHCFCVRLIPRAEFVMRRRVAFKESWFVRPPGVEADYLHLRNPDSVLCTRLREKSDFFKCLFQTHTKEMADGFMPIDRDEFLTFFFLMCYIRFSISKYNLNFECICDLYITADKYLLLELKEKFRDILKRHLVNDTAAEIFAVADLCFDPDLRELALQHVILNWNEVRTTEGWAFLRDRRPDLATEVSDLVENNAELNVDIDEAAERHKLHATEFDFYQ